MNKITLSFIMTTIAGLSTTLGIIPCFLNKNKKEKIISAALAFSSGIMITISIFSLIPKSLNLLNETYKVIPTILITALFIILGVYLSTIIDNIVEEKVNTNALHRLGVISALVLIIHNIPEGITTYASTTANTTLGIQLTLAIALHNIPEGISIAIPIYYSTKNKLKAFLYTLIAGLSELLGAFLAFIFFKDNITPLILSIILSLTSGIMIDISIYEFIPNAFKYEKNKATIYYFVLGIIIMFASEMFLF